MLLGNTKPVHGSRLLFGHPLAIGLAFSCVLNEAGGDIIADLSGNNNDGVFSNAPTWESLHDGTGLYFDGTDDYIVCGDGLGSLNWGAKDFSVCFGIKQDAVFSGIVVAKKRSGVYWKIQTQSDGDVYFYIYDGANVCARDTNQKPLNDLAYHNVVCRIDHSSTTGMRFFIDGIMSARNSNPTAVGSLDNTTALSIATRDAGSPGTYGKFHLSYLHIYNRALTASEILELHIDPYCMYWRDPIELWTAASPGAAPPVTSSKCYVVGKTKTSYATKNCVARNFITY